MESLMEKSDYGALLKKIVERNMVYNKLGKVASYIPALATANPEDIGISLWDVDGNIYSYGDYDKKFTIQSISKVVGLIIGLMDHGEDYIFNKLSVEATREAFDFVEGSLEKLDNPMTNAGAITICSLIKGDNSEEKLERVLSFTRKLCGNENIGINHKVFLSEKETGNKNKSIAYLLKSMGKIQGDLDEILDLYFKQCSIEVSARDLAHMGLIIANKGVNPETNEEIFPKALAKTIQAAMTIFGMYNESGKYFLDVGLPSKSGVGGGIMALVPNTMGIGVYSPALNERGNSIVGIEVLKDLSKELSLHLLG